MSISSVIDHTDIALANFIVRLSLSEYEHTVTTHDNFTFIGDKICHLFPTSMTYDACHIYCDSKSSNMLNTVRDVWRVDHSKDLRFWSIWIDTNTVINDTYQVFLGKTEIYPKITFTASGNPSVYFQDALELTEVDSIKTFYTNYYSST